jgi:carbamoyl-phosphate synthase small subunit
VIRELSPVVSNWRSDMSLAKYLEENNIPGIQGIDTRALTKKLRVRGALNGFISTEAISDEEALKRAREWPGLVGVDYVKEVTHKEPFVWDPEDQQSRAFALTQENNPPDARMVRKPMPAADLPIVAFDFGMKFSMGFGCRCFRRRRRRRTRSNTSLRGFFSPTDRGIPRRWGTR